MGNDGLVVLVNDVTAKFLEKKSVVNVCDGIFSRVVLTYVVVAFEFIWLGLDGLAIHHLIF